MDEVVKASDYRATQRKIVELPSGFKFEIRKMSPMIFAEVYGVTNVSPDMTNEAAEKLIQENVFSMIETVIPYCVVRPKIIAGESTNEDALSIYDIDPDDIFVLLEEITNFSGLGDADSAERKKFRTEPDGPGSGSD